MTVEAIELNSVEVGWVYERHPPMGGAAGEAYTNTLASSGMPPAAVLAREAIQNSVDARAKGEQKVAVDFVFSSLLADEKDRFVERSHLLDILARENELSLRQPNCLGSIKDPIVPLNLLFIDDYNTTGLAGEPSDPDSKFFRFLLSLGDGGKEHEEHGTGGSYGFGKSVYSSNSGILTIFAYSRTVDEKGEPLSLLFGCAYFRKHKHDGRNFTGRAWLGEDVSPKFEIAPQVVVPLRGPLADAYAAELGFEHRSAEQRGTSVLIVDATVTSEAIVQGVEDWWWPRLLTHQLDVRVISAEGGIQLPRPRKREDLQPFLDAFDLAVGKFPPNGKTDFRRPFYKYLGTSIGNAGFKVLDKTENDQFIVPEERVDSVALIRSPLMVVSYHRAWNIGAPAMAGAFIADDDIDDVLRAAEPPAHDRWDVDARRLQDETGMSRAIVRRVLENIRRNLRACQSTASPPPPARPKRLTILERTLARFLTPSGKGSGYGGQPSSAPIHLTYDQEPRVEAAGDALRLTAKFSVRLKGEEDIEELRARIRITCPVVEDGQTGDLLAVSVKTSTSLTDDPVKEGWSIFELGTSAVRFECTTETYNPLWTVRFVPEVEPVELA